MQTSLHDEDILLHEQCAGLSCIAIVFHVIYFRYVFDIEYKVIKALGHWP